MPVFRSWQPGYMLPAESGSYFLFKLACAAATKTQLAGSPGCAPDRKQEFFVCVGGENPAPIANFLRARDCCFAFIAGVDDHELRTLYRHARALIFPSPDEGFGLPLLEAMASDCPVLCSDTAVFHEVAGDAAIYFDPLQPEFWRLRWRRCGAAIARSCFGAAAKLRPLFLGHYGNKAGEPLS